VFDAVRMGVFFTRGECPSHCGEASGYRLGMREDSVDVGEERRIALGSGDSGAWGERIHRRDAEENERAKNERRKAKGREELE
jgi:hypothetical protein